MSEGGRHEHNGRRHRKEGRALDKLLDEARRAPTSGIRGADNARDRARNIAVGREGRNRACDGKARFARRAHAEKASADLRERHGDDIEWEVYACPFCAGFHFATPKG